MPLPLIASRLDDDDEAPALEETGDAFTRTVAAASAGPRKRGRPLLMSREQVMARVRETAAKGGLFRVHRDQPALYARARRLWGTWAAAVAASGLDYDETVDAARRRSVESRRKGPARKR